MLITDITKLGNQISNKIVAVKCDYCCDVKHIKYKEYLRSINSSPNFSCGKKSCKKQKTLDTNIIKYGVSNISQLSSIKDKIKRTNLEKYGVENVYQADEIKEKIRQRNLEKYGVEFSAQSDLYKLKIINTNIKRYGVPYVYQSPVIKERIKSTNLERYGVPYFSQCKEFKLSLHKSMTYKKYNGLLYQSSYELAFLKFCEINNIVVSDDPPRILYEFNNSKHYYFPDFLIPSLNLVVEIKSTYWMNTLYNKNIKKRKATESAGYTYVLVLDNDFSEILAILDKYNRQSRANHFLDDVCSKDK